MSNKPLVSIITVTCNLIEAGRKEFFKQCVDSVRMQDYPNIEHLIIDGASTDGTIELFDELNLDYTSEPDTGPYNAFNKGVYKASGKYIFFLNTDDRFLRNNAISDCVDGLEKNNADITYSGVVIDSADNKTSKISKAKLTNMFLAMPFCHSSVMMKTSLIKELGGFDEQYRIAADYDLIWKSFLKHAKLVEINNVFSSWRLGGVSSTNENIYKSEYVDILSKRANISKEEALSIYTTNYIPYKILKQLLKEVPTFPNHKEIIKANFKRLLKYVRRQLCTIHLSKNKKCLRLLGITFYNNEVK